MEKHTRDASRCKQPWDCDCKLGQIQEGGIWVRLSSGGKFESDQFAYNASAAKNVTSGEGLKLALLALSFALMVSRPSSSKSLV